MQVGDLLSCDHCPEVVVSQTAENGMTITRSRPVEHPIQGFVEARTIDERTSVDGPPCECGEMPPHLTTDPTRHPTCEAFEMRPRTIYDGRPILRCPTLYEDQVHDSAKMRLLGTMTRG